MNSKGETACFFSNQKSFSSPRQAPVVQTLDSAIHRINYYPADTYWTIHWTEIYRMDSAIQPLNNRGKNIAVTFPLVFRVLKILN